MSSQSPPTITSFVIRFVVDPSVRQDASSSFRGAIRHVHRELSTHFNSWSDAVDFIQRYVPLETGLANLDIVD